MTPATQTQSARPLTGADNQPTQTQADEALRQMMSKQAKPTLFEEQVKQISPDVVARRKVFDKPVSVELTKPAKEMMKADYDHAFARAVLKQAGMTDASDAEVSKFMNDYARVTGGKFELLWSEGQLQAYQKQHGSEMRAQTSDYGLAVADAGMRQIHADRQEYAARVEQMRRDSQAYGEDALAGFYKLQANGAINVVNDATKIVGAPELLKFDVGGEYWQDKKSAAEAATTVGAALVTGGASLPGDLLLIGSSAGNMAEAATGTDFRTGEELTTRERIMRGAGGVAGAYAVRRRVDDITEAVSSRVKNITPPANAMEAVTAEGATVRVPVREEIQLNSTQKMAGSSSTSRSAGAYETAKSGGKHSGTLKNYASRPTEQILKALGGYEKQVELHKLKLADPARFAEDWHTRSVQSQQGLLKHWQQDLERNAELADVMRGMLKEKGIKP